MILYSNSVVPFGKYKGQVVNQIPDSYKQWLCENTDHKILTCNAPVKDKFTEEERQKMYFARIENSFRVLCTKIGRQLIYENVQIPF